ncbi:hypothetical protein [Pedobacter chitinilyticus]|uniref:Uncharacterized protein n=1 Tax=Pedobacter chitinilyticus TaxID=2233776 RepID=A0A3S3PUK8_9SPHI|nr:hypothetical protein [Pedobacter chitinilyticus]RWU08454.1 hypothetical protein DPV69_08760 [Pedobacter chitinilyticus]
MKNKNLTFLKIAMVAVLGVATAVGCKKDQHQVEEKVEKLSVNYEKERRFLSIMLAVPLDKVIYNEKAEEFIVGERVTLSLKKVLELYGEANEYKLVYEK